MAEFLVGLLSISTSVISGLVFKSIVFLGG